MIACRLKTNHFILNFFKHFYTSATVNLTRTSAIEFWNQWFDYLTDNAFIDHN